MDIFINCIRQRKTCLCVGNTESILLRNRRVGFIKGRMPDINYSDVAKYAIVGGFPYRREFPSRTRAYRADPADFAAAN